VAASSTKAAAAATGTMTASEAAEPMHAAASEARVHVRNGLHRATLRRGNAPCCSASSWRLEAWVSGHSHAVSAALERVPAAVRRVYRIATALDGRVPGDGHAVRASLERVPAPIRRHHRILTALE
jgi:hypothetical protein